MSIQTIEQMLKRSQDVPAALSPSAVLYSGSRGDHGCVTLFLYGDRRPLALARVSRRLHDPVLEQEYECLRMVQSLLAGTELASQVEMPLGLFPFNGGQTLVKSYIAGTSGSHWLRWKGKRGAAQLLELTVSWSLDFWRHTSRHQVRDQDRRLQSLRELHLPAELHAAGCGLLESKSSVVGPSHGDLVPANVLLCDGRIAGIIDWENFHAFGFPVTDLVGGVVSIADYLYPHDAQFLPRIFLGHDAYARAVRQSLQTLRSELELDLADLDAAIQLYFLRAVSLCRRWNMEQYRAFHETARQSWFSHRKHFLSGMA
jgi:hypothetical protein